MAELLSSDGVGKQISGAMFALAEDINRDKQHSQLVENRPSLDAIANASPRPQSRRGLLPQHRRRRTGWRVKPHGRAAHNARRRGQHHRRICIPHPECLGQKFLSTAVAVFPFEHPGIGPNTFRFDDRVAYDIHVSLDNDDIAKGKTDLTYRFRFKTVFAPDTILSFGGLVQPDRPGVFPANQNLRQTYTVTLIDHRLKGVTSPFINRPTVLGTGMVPPNNQGRVTRFYNQNNDGDRPAKPGVSNPNDLDPYTKNTIFELKNGHRVFAGQRDDGFYA